MAQMTPYAAIAVGGAAGALLRFVVGSTVSGAVSGSFPWPTFVVNVTGSAILGFVYLYSVERLGPAARLGLTTGLLGAFTTFSTFSVETLQLMRSGTPVDAFLYALSSLVSGLLAAWLGVFAADSLLR